MSFFQNTRKPEGLGGKIMVATMNIGGHAALAQWGLSQLTLGSDLNILEMGCGGRANVAQLLKRCPNGKDFPTSLCTGIQRSIGFAFLQRSRVGVS